MRSIFHQSITLLVGVQVCSITWGKKQLNVIYHLIFLKCGISLGEYKSETSPKQNYKCSLYSINPKYLNAQVWRP